MNSIFVYALGFQRTSFRIIFLIQLLRKQLTILNYIPVVRVCDEFHQLGFLISFLISSTLIIVIDHIIGKHKQYNMQARS